MIQAAECFHVWKFVEEEMTARGWGRDDLAFAMAQEGDTVEDVVRNRLIVDLMSVGEHRENMWLGQSAAEGLARAFGTSVELWLSLDKSWHAWVESGGRERLTDAEGP